MMSIWCKGGQNCAHAFGLRDVCGHGDECFRLGTSGARGGARGSVIFNYGTGTRGPAARGHTAVPSVRQGVTAPPHRNKREQS